MRRMLELDHHDVRAALYDLFRKPVFHLRYGLTMHEERELTMARWRAIVEAGFLKGTVATTTPAGRSRFMALIESVGMLDHSLDIKMSVHYGLFGSAVALLIESPHRFHHAQTKRVNPKPTTVDCAEAGGKAAHPQSPVRVMGASSSSLLIEYAPAGSSWNGRIDDTLLAFSSENAIIRARR